MTTSEQALTPVGVQVLRHLEGCGATAQSNTEIARWVDRDARTILRVLAQLEDDGLIDVDRRRRNRHAGDPTGRTLTITRAGHEYLADLDDEVGA